MDCFFCLGIGWFTGCGYMIQFWMVIGGGWFRARRPTFPRPLALLPLNALPHCRCSLIVVLLLIGYARSCYGDLRFNLLPACCRLPLPLPCLAALPPAAAFVVGVGCARTFRSALRGCVDVAPYACPALTLTLPQQRWLIVGSPSCPLPAAPCCLAAYPCLARAAQRPLPRLLLTPCQRLAPALYLPAAPCPSARCPLTRLPRLSALLVGRYVYVTPLPCL